MRQPASSTVARPRARRRPLPFGRRARARWLLRILAISLLVANCTPDTLWCETTADDQPVCLDQLASEADWQLVSMPSPLVDQVRTGKYLVPAREDARLPALLMNVNVFTTHWAFLRQGFPELFGSLSEQEYEQLIVDPMAREFYAGLLTEYQVPDQARVFGFVIWDRQLPEQTVACQAFQDVHAALAESVALSPLVAVPATQWQRNVLAHCDVPSYDPAKAVEYEAYQTGYAFGTIRRYTLSELGQATETAAFGWRDILILDEAPFDVETVIAGAVTGTRQGELSHLSVRSAARGTPNCYLRGAYELLARHDGELVRLECTSREVRVSPATMAQAQAWWDAFRPAPVDVPAPDREFSELVDLHDVPTRTAEERALATARFGAKGANLAALYQRIAPELQLAGFVVPIHHYDAFMRTGRWIVEAGQGSQEGEELSFAETIERWLTDDRFHMDVVMRRARLASLRAAMRATPCDPALLEALRVRILATFGSDTIMVRFRSSSNAEDSLAFSGAGLYDSLSACLADDLDGDDLGPSRCDADKEKERPMCPALTEVWASLWKSQAFDERDWYGIDHGDVGMGILVNTRTDDELANMVVFSGVPGGGDPYLVNAQLGEYDVVSSRPGMWPEKNLLTLDRGQVTAIERARRSSLMPEGQVLTDEQLAALGALLWDIVESFPIDGQIPAGRRVLLDTEWKVGADGQLIIKQVRPFLD